MTVFWQYEDKRTDRLTSTIQSFTFFKTCIDNQYALHWTPNAYRNMLMRIFTPSLYFQCVFNDFQCVITLLRALSVALGTINYFSYIVMEHSRPYSKCWPAAGHPRHGLLWFFYVLYEPTSTWAPDAQRRV